MILLLKILSLKKCFGYDLAVENIVVVNIAVENIVVENIIYEKMLWL
jgi:hypothetical protein